MKVNLCACNNCCNYFIDTNPQVDAKVYDIRPNILKELVDHKCPVCRTDDYLTDDIDEKELIFILIK